MKPQTTLKFQYCHLKHHAGYHFTNIIETIFCRTDRYLNSFFLHIVIAWNGIGPVLRVAETSIFKKNILKVIRPVKKTLCNIHNSNGIRWIFQLRVGLSPLKSDLKSHNFQSNPDDLCAYSRNAEINSLKWPNYNEHRHLLFQTKSYSACERYQSSK